MDLIGAALFLIGFFWLVVRAFREGALWGFGCLVIPLVWLYFAATRPRESAAPALLVGVGVIAYALGHVPVG